MGFSLLERFTFLFSNLFSWNCVGEEFDFLVYFVRNSGGEVILFILFMQTIGIVLNMPIVRGSAVGGDTPIF